MLFTYADYKQWKVIAAPYDVRLFYEEDESDDTVVQPDIVVVCDEKKRGYEGCRGAPDFVVEILSPSNTVIEMRHKLDLYREAGVREYWLADPENNELAVYRLEEGTSVPVIYEASAIVEAAIFPGLLIPLEEIFAP